MLCESHMKDLGVTSVFFTFLVQKKILQALVGRKNRIRDVCGMDFETCFKVHNYVSVYPKSIKLGSLTNLTEIFHVVLSGCLSIA